MRVDVPAAIAALALSMITAAQAQTLHGTVRDPQGAPVASATVTLSCDASAGSNMQAATAADGRYAFPKLPECNYRMHVQQGAASTTLNVNVGRAEDAITQDVTIAPDPSALARPKFEASGIRGLIDPGGYSAPANAAAASGLLSGMAEANRAREAACAPGRPLAEVAAAHAQAPSDAAAAMNYAQALLTAQQFASAREVLSRISDSDGGARWLRLRARAGEGLGQFGAAAQNYAELYTQHPDPDVLFAEGYEEILAGRPAAAAALYRNGLLAFPAAVPLFIGLATTEFFAGHTAEAADLYLRAADADPVDSRPYPFLAAVSGIPGADGNRVNAAVERHLKVTPNDAAAHVALAVVWQHREAAPETAARAEAELRRALSSDPGMAEAHIQLGTLLARRGADNEAMRELQLAVALDPGRREAHYRLAQELRKSGQVDAAAKETEHFQQARDAEDSGGAISRYLSVMRRPNACSAP